MPKQNITQIQLPAEQPDCCTMCPLLGLIPKSMRKAGSLETYVCCGTMEAISSRMIYKKSSEKDSHHPLHRPCDCRWDAWMTLPGRRLGISFSAYTQLRLPYEQGLQFQIKFHK